MQMETQKCAPTRTEPGSDDQGHHGMRKARHHNGPPYLIAGSLIVGHATEEALGTIRLDQLPCY